jgi:ribokinase
MTDICVVGSSNIDLISYVPRLAVRGETLLGERFAMGFGGKGANQAVMAAKLGASVVMVTMLGDDVFGRQTLDNFTALGISADHILFTKEAFSGVAPIMVEPGGGNSIVVVPGANGLLRPGDAERAAPAIRAAKVLICQLEIPVETTLRALEIAREAGVLTILNPAPAVPDLPRACYGLADILCPNETEAEILTGIGVRNMDLATAAVRVLRARGAGRIIFTLGEKGCIVAEDENIYSVPAVPAEAVDTTGAGDAFVGSLAFYLARGRSLADAVFSANRIAALSVQKSGTQTSYPNRKDLPENLK